MDLLTLQPNTLTVDLKHPATGEPLGVTVELRSLESDEVKAVERSIKNRALKSGRNAVSAEKIDDNTAALLSAAIVSWTFSGDANLGGDKKPACTDANKRKLLAVPAIAKQIDQALGDEAAFFASSASA
ncbi:hypothetical protein B5M44_19175 [Shinella sumterensis]|jgi:hypothetical protein|uniref:hypothetical protein n=1 Tax=Shinella sumterensis TaxID=1967501 RepID=UPI00106EBD43|nr:hypothetical protein [Shinella sumterensis]MCD1266072.1 hypothetical protein [Shinella sumterensis]TFE96561.1 hypothetical protein B5M44_19175 [Shinella sumterensis]